MLTHTFLDTVQAKNVSPACIETSLPLTVSYHKTIFMHTEEIFMTPGLLTILSGWLIAVAFFFGFMVLLRYLQHRERMAMITYGMNPHKLARHRRSRGILRAGLIITMVGLALTVGLYPIGFILPSTFSDIPFHFGPWLLPGLIPLAVGMALTASYYLERDAIVNDEPAKSERNDTNENTPTPNS
jgi:hypothetical protein